MKTYYVIDGTNNNKVVAEYHTKKEARQHINELKFTEDWKSHFKNFSDYKAEFRIIDSEQMEKRAKIKGNSVKNYFN